MTGLKRYYNDVHLTSCVIIPCSCIISFIEKVEQLVEKKLSGKDKLTPWEQYLEKKREKRKQNREKTKLEETEGTSQTESKDDTPSDIDMNDPYFKYVFFLQKRV